jgi:rare lipoprotein A (peptidoglycan hydrolase)
MPRRFALAVLLAVTALLSACAPGKLPPQKVGRPYVVNGESYYPAYEADYDKTGMASWYGPGFHGGYTASGETYDQNDLTAAHPTLPMPSLVRVTNLENGKSLIVRINDRGPFAGNRLIDLSKKSAQMLGIKSLAEVRVQFLEKETQDYIAMVKAHGNTIIPMAEYNRRAADVQVAEQQDDPSVDAVPAPTITVAQGDIESHDAAPPQVAAAIAADLPPRAEPKMKHTVPRLFVQEAQAEELPQQVAAGDSDDALADVTPSAGEEKLPREAPEVLDNSPDMDDLAPPPPSAKSVTALYPAVPESAVTPTPESPPPVSVGNYTIQAGAFSSEKNARKLVEKLQPIGDTFVDQIGAGSKTLWRVRVGGFAAPDYADEVLMQVRKLVPDARVVRK